MGSTSNTRDTLHIVTRGSALALVQARHIQGECQRLFPDLTFELKVMKTTGDHLQAVGDVDASAPMLPKGLFTKELETALFKGEGDMAVHSLKDLPTDLPDGLKLGAVTEREDVREILVLKTAPRLDAPGHPRQYLSAKACLATNSPRRQVQLKRWNPDLKVVPMRGNVPTRLRKLAESREIEAIVLARAGLNRLGYRMDPSGKLSGEAVPSGLYGVVIDVEHMVPCVGQGCLGIEIRAQDERMHTIAGALSHPPSSIAASAERAFLKHMGGGCQTPYAAHGSLQGSMLKLVGRAFHGGVFHDAELQGKATQALSLGMQLAEALKP
ncbi:MAG: hydroxymethylbilane synthase [Verrucomicrobiota bacterium]|nr:hydroxymethylbilane synthase [Verrucomicrobiota bacterium]